MLIGDDMSQLDVNGTMVWYYYICKREVWMIARHIVADQSDENIDIGRFIHDKTYKRDKREVSVEGVKIDRVRKNGEDIVVSEIKKSSKYEEASRMQLLLYLQILRKKGIQAKGVLKYPMEKKNIEIELDNRSEKLLNDTKREILKLIYSDTPPSPVKIKYCSRCAYKEMCWCDEL